LFGERENIERIKRNTRGFHTKNTKTIVFKGGKKEERRRTCE
jgi:hypothetical protein